MTGPNMFSLNAASGGGWNPRAAAGNQTDPAFPVLPVIGAGLALGGGIASAIGSSKKQKPSPLSWEQIQSMFGAGAMTKDTNKFYSMLRNSPGWYGMRAGAMRAGNRHKSNMMSRIGSSGLSNTLMGAHAAAGAENAGTNFALQGDAQLFGQAMNQAQQNAMMRMNMLMSQQQLQQTNAQIPGFWDMLGGSMMGASSNMFGGMI